jgi:hypothetical protein
MTISATGLEEVFSLDSEQQASHLRYSVIADERFAARKTMASLN